MNPIVIIGCGARKQDVPCAARHLYTGTLFQAALAWALATAHETDIRILSAKYGFVNLDATLHPYDVTWRSGDCVSTGELAAQMLSSWRGREFILLCGADYRTEIIPAYFRAFNTPMRMQAPLFPAQAAMPLLALAIAHLQQDRFTS